MAAKKKGQQQLDFGFKDLTGSQGCGQPIQPTKLWMNSSDRNKTRGPNQHWQLGGYFRVCVETMFVLARRLRVGPASFGMLPCK